MSSTPSPRLEIFLRIFHPDIDSNEITRQLNVAPDYCYTAGTSRFTPKGNKLPGYNKKTFWIARIKKETGDDLLSVSEAIEYANNIIISARDFILLLRDGGGRVEYFIGWIIKGNAGDKLDWALLAQCADLKIDVVLDLYPLKRGSSGACGVSGDAPAD